jgi:hypothetical protein
LRGGERTATGGKTLRLRLSSRSLPLSYFCHRDISPLFLTCLSPWREHRWSLAETQVPSGASSPSCTASERPRRSWRRRRREEEEEEEEEAPASSADGGASSTRCPPALLLLLLLSFKDCGLDGEGKGDATLTAAARRRSGSSSSSGGSSSSAAAEEGSPARASPSRAAESREFDEDDEEKEDVETELEAAIEGSQRHATG